MSGVKGRSGRKKEGTVTMKDCRALLARNAKTALRAILKILKQEREIICPHCKQVAARVPVDMKSQLDAGKFIWEHYAGKAKQSVGLDMGESKFLLLCKELHIDTPLLEEGDEVEGDFEEVDEE